MKSQAPSILFIDEIDSIASKKESNAPKEMEKRILSQLFACLDEISDKDVFVIGATGKPESLDPGLRRSGRFDKEISLAIPNEKARFEILQRKTKETKLDSVDLFALAKAIPGYVGADIESLIKEVQSNPIFLKLVWNIRSQKITCLSWRRKALDLRRRSQRELQNQDG